jgi:predicted amidophosphoribosyltransferase
MEERELVEIKGCELDLLSYGNCICCGQKALFLGEKEARCEFCGAEYLFDFDEHGFLKRAFLLK